ncbi:conjugal transfer protein MobB [Barnesiella intestinihominis]
MVAKINRGVSLYGAVIYNQRKVDEATARIIAGNRMITDLTGNPHNVMQQTLWAFESYLAANRNTEKPVLHISLNPSVDDRLTDGQFAELAREYMQKMGYGDQPYIVYLHEDIDRRHVHIVSTCVKENGEKISDAYEWNRSMKACRELENEFGLKPVADKRNELLAPYLKKADYRDGDVKRQVGNILKSVFTAYRFQTFGEFSAMLSCFNIEAKQVRGEFEGSPYNGIVYTLTDDTGRPVCTPIKSSLIGKRFGYEGIEKRIAVNVRDFRNRKWQPKIHDTVALAMHGCRGNREDFIRLLGEKGIDVVFRENEEGRIYGVTFIDHKNREVYNGSRLGKEFSANAFEQLFSRPQEFPEPEAPGQYAGTRESLSDSMESTIEQAFGIFSPDINGPDPQEEALARKLQRKKKKKKRRSRGIS